jgi:hypothetical protein
VAQTFKNSRALLAGASTDIYICPASTTAIVIGFQVSNVDTSARTLDLTWTDFSTTNVTYLAKTISIPAGATFEPIGGRMVLEAGDKISGLGSTASQLYATLSILEIV